MRAWVSWFLGLPTRVARDIVNWVSDLVNGLTGLTEDAISWLTGWIAQVSSWAVDQIGRVTDWINGIIHWADTMMRDLFNQATQYVRDLISDVRNFINGTVAAINSAIGDVSGWAHAAIDAVYQWGHDYIWVPLSAGITGLHDLIENTIVPWVIQQVANAIQAVENRFDAIITAVRTEAGHILDPIFDVIQIVRKAWDWLAWFATHELTDVWDLLFGHWNFNAKSALDSIVASFLAHGDDAEQIVTRWIFGLFLLPFTILHLAGNRRRHWRRRMRG